MLLTIFPYFGAIIWKGSLALNDLAHEPSIDHKDDFSQNYPLKTAMPLGRHRIIR